VGLGQTVCLPVGRRCGDCDLGLKGLCRAAERKKVLEGRRRREALAIHTKEETLIEVDGTKVGEIKVEEVEIEGGLSTNSLAEDKG
jgi:endonuclease III